MRGLVLREGYRADGRALHEVRPITCRAGALPRTHGSALFTRGETQAIAVTTLGVLCLLLRLLLHCCWSTHREHLHSAWQLGNAPVCSPLFVRRVCCRVRWCVLP